MNNQWSSIIFSRTYEVDFRLISIPEDFKEREKKWALDYIYATMTYPKELQGNPIYSIFKNNKYCVVGITCMIKDLIQNSHYENLEVGTRDKPSGGEGREVYGFFGYVTKKNSEEEFPIIPLYGNDNKEFFRQLYEDLEKRWFVKVFQKEAKESIVSSYEVKDYSFTTINSRINEYFSLNQDNNQIRLWSEKNSKEVWMATAQEISNYPEKSISLCLGIVRKKDAIKSPFFNATVYEVKQREDVGKQVKNAEETLPEYDPVPRHTSSKSLQKYAYENLGLEQDRYSKQSYSNSLILEPVELVGGAGGALIGLIRICIKSGLTISGGLTSVFIAAGIGAVSTGYITKKGIGGKIRHNLEEVTGKTTKNSRNYQNKNIHEEQFTYQKRTRNSSNDDSDWI